MSNERNAGRKTKYKIGTITKKLQDLIPIEAETEIKQSINKITQKWKTKQN